MMSEEREAKTPNFLIVDDDPNTRKVLSFLLRPYGMCITAANGADALAIYEQQLVAQTPFDLVLLDMQMPDVTGEELLTSLRAIERQRGTPDAASGVPVIFLSGDADTRRINRVRELNIAEYILKPVQEARLLRALERLEIIEPEHG